MRYIQHLVTADERASTRALHVPFMCTSLGSSGFALEEWNHAQLFSPSFHQLDLDPNVGVVGVESTG